MVLFSDSPPSLLRVAERGEERLVTVPGSQDLCQILQDVGDDVYQQYRLTRQGSDFDSQSAFHINVSLRASTINSLAIQSNMRCTIVMLSGRLHARMYETSVFSTCKEFLIML